MSGEEGNSINPMQNLNPPSRSLAIRHIYALAVVIIFSACGMISIGDFSFVVFSIVYIIFLSKFAFPPLSLSPEPPVFSEKNQLLGYYVLFAAFIGLIFPIAYILEGIYSGNKEDIMAAVPHVFLLSSQVFMEGVTFSHPFSLPVRAFVPVFYNTKRIFTIFDWLWSEIGKVDEEFSSQRRLQIARGLAIANLILWCYNLFGFLLPVYLPRVFKRYYGYKT